MTWKSFSFTDNQITSAEKVATLPDNFKTAKEIIIHVEVAGAGDLARNLIIIPNYAVWNGSYLRREAQEGTVWVLYSDNKLHFGAYNLQGLSPYIAAILYR